MPFEGRLGCPVGLAPCQGVGEVWPDAVSGCGWRNRRIPDFSRISRTGIIPSIVLAALRWYCVFFTAD